MLEEVLYMIYSIVDLGSNTIRLCLYEYSNNSLKSILERKTMAGLANFVKHDKLSQTGIDRACEILNEYKGILSNFQITEKDVHVVATASLRNIVNTQEVINIIKEVTGFQVELLSGETEATLDFIGATKSIDVDSGIVVDIGGGSTEIVVFDNREIQLATSMPIGSLNLYVKYVKKIIPKEEERLLMQKVVRDNLEALEIKPKEYTTICGVGGTIRAAGKLNNTIFKLNGNPTEIEVNHISKILELLKNSKKSTLTPVLQIIPDRIHTIIPGLIILNTISEYFGCKNIIVSKFGIREGYLYERILKGE
jgi:exopolyphosphatase/guanosine-5'-triphosphate,3'-diphosphate pyrophosphatase